MAQLRPLDCGTGATRWCIFFLRLFWKFSLKAFSDGNVALDSQAAPLSSTKWFWRQHGCWGGLFRPRWGSVSFAYQWEVCGTDCSRQFPETLCCGWASFNVFPQAELAGLRFRYLQQTVFSRTHIKTSDNSGTGNNTLYSQSKPNNQILTYLFAFRERKQIEHLNNLLK